MQGCFFPAARLGQYRCQCRCWEHWSQPSARQGSCQFPLRGSAPRDGCPRCPHRSPVCPGKRVAERPGRRLLGAARTGGEVSRSSTSAVGEYRFSPCYGPSGEHPDKDAPAGGLNPHSLGTSSCKKSVWSETYETYERSIFFHFNLIKQKRKNILELIRKPENTLTFLPYEI